MLLKWYKLMRACADPLTIKHMSQVTGNKWDSYLDLLRADYSEG